MKQIPIAELIPGMVTAEDILSYNNKVIVPKGIILTENIISRLDAYSIYGPSITSHFALIIENGYSFKTIIYPMKNTIAAIPPDTVNKNGP